MIEQEKKQKTLRQAFRELIKGHDVINNLKFIIIAFLGFLKIKK